MNVWGFYQWLRKQMTEQTLAEDAELIVDNGDDILLRVGEPVIDIDGDVSFTTAE